MASRDMSRWETGIANVISTKSEEEVVVRGHRLSDLVGEVSFAEMMFLLIKGTLPTQPQARVLDALLVASIEHGIAPPSMISRCMASYGSPLQAAVAGGVLAFGDWMGGAGEQLAQLLVSHLDPSVAAEKSLPETELRQAAGDIVAGARKARQRVAGYGIPLHAADPRAPKLMAVAKAENVYGNFCRLATCIEAELEAQTGHRVPMNLDGVGAALILDLGLPWRSARLFIITPRTVSMGAHYLEELGQDTRWRHIAQSQIDYQP